MHLVICIVVTFINEIYDFLLPKKKKKQGMTSILLNESFWSYEDII